MADTARGYWPKLNCSDCGENEVVIFKHWGPLVPEDKVGYFCPFCWNNREENSKNGEASLPLGIKPPIENGFIHGKIKVVTENSVYRFEKPNKEKIRCATRNNLAIPFPCKINCLKVGRPLYIKFSCKGEKIETGINLPMWISSNVLSIEKF